MEYQLWVWIAVIILFGGITAVLAAVSRRKRRTLLACVASAAIVISPMAAVASVGGGSLQQQDEVTPFATDEDPAFELLPTDLAFILDQIEISEAHAERFAEGETGISGLLCQSNDDTSGKCVRDPSLPHGLRTVDGSFNNLEFNKDWGSSNEIMPRMLGTEWREADPTSPGSPLPDGDRSMCADPASSCYEQTDGTVYDTQPREISNLIVDTTTANPAAVAAAESNPGAEIDPATGEVFVPNIQADEGLSAPVNLFFVFFGQFFDHGLDQVSKGGNGTIIVPLSEDDPLYNSTPPNLRFMMLNRATNQPDGQREHENRTTPFVDQNQTYTSHPAHHVFLREYVAGPNGPEDTGRLLSGADTDGDGKGDGLATWNDVKAQANDVLGINLVDEDVLAVPQVAVDLYGNFAPGPDRGMPQLVLTGEGGGMVEGNVDSPIETTDAINLPQAFLDDIANGAVPAPPDPATPELAGYDNVLLGEHFISGDGRGNENIGLTSVHHVFHSEHNRLAEDIEAVLNDPANAELLAAYEDQSESDDWSYDQRLFQAARFGTEMQYQHLVFEEFARTVQPTIDTVVFNENSYDSTINPAIKAEFAHVVYRFGHSMLTQDLNREGFGTTPTTLLDGFLNPVAFHCASPPVGDNECTPGDELNSEQAAGALINGTTDQVANQVDEMITSTLRNNLLGLPLDLATINIMRGRDVGVPGLQEARRTFYAESGDPNLEPYASWEDYGLALRNGENFGRGESQASLVNFIAAYGNHDSILAEDTLAGRRAAAEVLVLGVSETNRVERMSGSNRYGTAAAISRSAFAGTVDTVYIANGLNYPDALAGGPAATVDNAPLLLVGDNTIPSETALELARLQPAEIKVLGGSSVVTDQVMNSLATYTSTDTVTRLSGANRYATAAAISEHAFPDGATTAYVASGADFPDALSGGSAAAAVGAPLLLVSPTGAVPAATAAELERLGVTDIKLLGGEAAISAATATALGGYGTVERLSGTNRYQTSVAISEATFPDTAGGTVYLASGTNFPDALSAAPVAGLNGSPLLLVPGTSSTLPTEVANEILRLNPSRVVMLGGESAVSLGMQTAVEALFPAMEAPADRAAFMSSTGAYANVDGLTVTGLESVDFWVGGLAEAVEPFGGMLGATFNYVFEGQLEDLQFGDRFYYLFRNQGNHLFQALEANSFSSLIQRNTDASILPANIFTVQEPTIDLENLPNPLPAGLFQTAGQWRWDGDEHIEIHGHRTDADNIRGGQGDDALWGYGGNDRIIGGSGNDAIVGGQGDDILTDTFGDDNIKGQQGNDVIDGGAGIDLLLAGPGDDFIRKTQDNADGATGFFGTGDDIFLGGTGRDNPFGNEGDDWLESGPHADLLVADNGQQFQNDLDGGDDVLIGGAGSDDYDAEGGDDILVGEVGSTDRFHGMFGWDTVTYYGEDAGVDADLNFNLLQPPDVTAIRDRFTQVEALSGGPGNDVLRGLGVATDDLLDVSVNRLTEEGLDLIVGLEDLLRPSTHPEDYALRFMEFNPQQIDNDGNSNLLLGGPGGDLMEGRFGDDFMDGDAMLRVRLVLDGQYYDSAADLASGMVDGSINPGDVDIVRDIVSEDDGATDTAVYSDALENYTIEDLTDGYYRVSHTTVGELEEAEGFDVIRNMEILQFSGGCLIVDEAADPVDWEQCPVLGSVTFDGQINPPTEDQALSATVLFEDENGVETVASPSLIRFNWQNGEVGEEWEPSPTGDSLPDASNGLTDTFTPGDGDVAAILRVVVTFEDDDGNLRSIASEALPDVVNVNDEPSEVTLTTLTPRVNQALVPSPFTDGDGTESSAEVGITYTWQTSSDPAFGSDVTDVAVKTTPGQSIGYLVVPADEGRHVRVVITYTDDQGTAETIISPVTEAVLPINP